MPKLDLEDANVVEVSITLTQARELEFAPDELNTAIDEAQAYVFGGDHKEAFVVIRIVG